MSSLWTSALRAAERTPPERNRYVDFLRAASIAAVVTGHWTIAAPHVTAEGTTLGHMLSIAPWTQWLTWIFQVMPVFFVVGGYSNAASWSSALRDGRSYGEWLASRIQRLLGPLMPLLLFWILLGVVTHRAGVEPDTLRIASQAALVPIWFLSVYVLVVLLVPLTHSTWVRLRFGSFALFAAAACAVDLAAFAFGLSALRWTNYLFVWLAVHQLGYAWRDGALGGIGRALGCAAAGLATLVALLAGAGYPLSMVGVPGEEVSNTLPPTLAMLGLGCLQFGLVLALEAPARRWLGRTRVWAATVLVNGMIMTIYLWHVTVLTLLVGLGVLLGGVGLRLEPGSGAWWAARVPWMSVMALGLVPFVAVFGRYERAGGAPPTAGAWRLVLGSLMICGGLALAALDGIAAEGPLGIRWGVVALALGGAALASVRPLPRAAG